MEQAIGLLTGGAEGAADAQDPSRTIASERALAGGLLTGILLNRSGYQGSIEL